MVRVIGAEDLFHAVELRRLRDHVRNTMARDEHMDIATDLFGRTEGSARGGANGFAVMVGEYENCHVFLSFLSCQRRLASSAPHSRQIFAGSQHALG